MKTVLVTGGSGFIGSNLLPQLLDEGFRVRALVRNDRHGGLADQHDVELVTGDIRDSAALARAVKGVDVVFHMAGLVSYWRPRKNELHEINVIGTHNIVSACLREGVGRLVFTSSVGAVGVPENGMPGTESTPWNWDPHSYYYCLSKYMAEGEVLRGAAAGQSVVILNPALVVGPKDINWNAGRIFAMVSRRDKMICTNGSVSVVDVADVCRAHIAAARIDQPSTRYILAGLGISYRDLFLEVARIMGKPKVKIKVVSDRTALLAAYAKVAVSRATRREPNLTPELIRMNTRWRVYDSSAAKRDLAFQVTPLQETLRRTYDWYRTRGLL